MAILLASNVKLRNDDGENKANNSLYERLFLSLLNLTSTGPENMFAASILSRFIVE